MALPQTSRMIRGKDSQEVRKGNKSTNHNPDIHRPFGDANSRRKYVIDAKNLEHGKSDEAHEYRNGSSDRQCTEQVCHDPDSIVLLANMY